MNLPIVERVLMEADYMIETGKTIRETATYFKMSKSTVHKDLHERLCQIDKVRNEKIKHILTYHMKIRHIRGGESTRKKYLKETLPSIS
ncbi:MAG: sporulation transcriptional regulator SpoIIID [Bacilli bacterium]|nr:sporulation transcriptional regulator SpoIIID [Bacilli bacterium]